MSAEQQSGSHEHALALKLEQRLAQAIGDNAILEAVVPSMKASCGCFLTSAVIRGQMLVVRSLAVICWTSRVSEPNPKV